MAAETVNPDNVRKTSSSPKRILAAVAIAAGKSIARNADKQAILADANGDAYAKRMMGVATSSAAAGQWLEYENDDPDFTPGFTVTPGSIYVLSATPGGICLAADLAAGHKTTFVGIGKASNKLWLKIGAPASATEGIVPTP